MTPSVSVAIATYNYGRYLGEALDSVLGQTFSDMEVVIIDDESTDDTHQVAEPYLGDSRVSYERIAHAGVAGAKNAALARCRAPLIALLDADDRWLPRKLEKQLPLFDVEPRPGVVYCRRTEIGPSGVATTYRQPQLYRGRVLEDMFRENFVCYSSAIVRRDVIDAVGPFTPALPLAVDYDLWLRVALLYPFDYVDEPLVEYRRGHANLSVRDAERTEIALEIMSRFLDQGGRAALSPSAIRQAKAHTYCNLALARRSQSRLKALALTLRALALAPTYGKAWKGLAALPMPHHFRQLVRRALGRPDDWDAPATVATKVNGCEKP